MVLAGSVLEDERHPSTTRKIKNKQQHAEVASRRAGSPWRTAAPRMAESARRSPGGAATAAARKLPLRPKLRKILVESQCPETGTASGSVAVGGGAGSLLSSSSSRSRNSPAVAERCAVSGGGGGGGGGGASAPRKRRSAARPPKDVLSVGESRSAATSTSRRSASPVLTRPALPKSASLPADLKASAAAAPAPRPGILKRSSSFLSARGLCALLRRRSPPPAAPPIGREDARLAVRRPPKSVSFSADTSFAERQRAGATAAARRTAPVHEAKLYRRGVLQDRNGCGGGGGGEEPAGTNLPLSWEESLGGPRALLGAAQDGDDDLVKKIVTLANKAGLGDIDVNAVDASGRTAISYMAGNGSALVLEACLSLPGADANLPDNEGNTPLHFAAQAGQTECLNILLQRCPSIEVDARNSLGFTPLMKAALQGRTKCAKVLLFAGANPTLRDHGRGLRAEQWARFCGRYVCAEVIERFARHRLLEKTTSCRWGSEPELAAQVLQGKLMPIPPTPVQPPPSGLKSKIRRVFRTSSSHTDKSFSLVSQLTSAALCASSPVLPKPGDVSPVVKSLLRPLSVPQLRITLVAPQDIIDKTSEKCSSHSATYTEKIESTIVKPPRTKKKSK